MFKQILSDVRLIRARDAPTKRQIKRAYLRGEIGLSDAVPTLVLDHGMIRGDAFSYLGL